MKALDADALYTACDPSRFGFDDTSQLADLEGLLGQDRAEEALHFGLGIRQHGYNLFVLGPSGMGKHTMVSQFLRQCAGEEPIASDWIYVANFAHPDKPRAIELAAGRGSTFAHDMRQLVEDLRSAIPNAFETEQYHARLQELHGNFQDRSRQVFIELAEEAEKHGVTVLRARDEFSFVPLKDGRPMKTDEYDALPEEEQQRLSAVISSLEDKLRGILHQRSQWQRELREAIKALNREVGMFAVGHLIEDLREKYHDVEAISEYLSEVQEDVIDNLNAFRDEEEEVLQWETGKAGQSFRRYQVNVLVDNSQASGAPVVYEDLPIFQNLIGRIEYVSQMGTLVTDYMLVRAGALHEANGGYLVLDAHRLLTQPFAWEALKRMLYAGEIYIESPAEMYSLISTVTLEPEPIPLKLKVVLVGERYLYYLLQAYDPDFAELFKVQADFENSIDSNDDNQNLYARLLATLIRKDQLLHFERDAVARIVEHSRRAVEDTRKLSVHMRGINDLLQEADYWARQGGRERVSRADVQQAIDKQIYRADRMQRHVVEEIRRGTLLIDTEGGVTAQVNALVVNELGRFAFGHPARVTATVRVGEGEVVDIEREVDLGGSIHSKGVMILSAYLAARFAGSKPLSLAATLVFEQNYGGIEGDSATVAELCALLSALADLPIRQSLAVTGSANQRGQLQPVGGINEKIEGFFDVCRARGLNGEQGVVIPATNVEHLMLREDVVEAARQGQFHIYAVATVDEAIEVLTGISAGAIDAQGEYPKDTVNDKVKRRLEDFAETRHEFARPGDGDEDDEDDRENQDHKPG
ncbi:Lon protease family protein [Thiohalophilus sp.]|uniref:Lon protease family protein n=1 Tax=Thiohalophilus sp. TaxID=3028392 RepID=UPI002ACDBB15|nr:AAA family ATPase [Thiohalophilus sp.]MDZ7662432.1 AAA family ATPase [Thiohalophilus sp.]